MFSFEEQTSHQRIPWLSNKQISMLLIFDLLILFFFLWWDWSLPFLTLTLCFRIVLKNLWLVICNVTFKETGVIFNLLQKIKIPVLFWSCNKIFGTILVQVFVIYKSLVKIWRTALRVNLNWSFWPSTDDWIR